MSSIPQSPAAKKLVQAFADISSTEDFIIYVASTDNMLSFCQEILEQYDRDNLALMTLEINSLCAAQGILPNLLYSEIRKVLIALNRFHDTSQDHYSTLGLQSKASIDEVKKAYRQLSKHYHPDMMQKGGSDTQRFMEIAGAYHAIMATLSEASTPGAPKPWRENNRSLKAKRRFNQKAFFLTVVPFILALTLISLYVSKKYDEQIILSQMQAGSTAGSYSKNPVKPVQPVENTTLSTKPPQVELEQTPDPVVKETSPLTPVAEPEQPIISSTEDETALEVSSQPDTDLAAVEETPSPDKAEPVKQPAQKPVDLPLVADIPEKQMDQPIPQIVPAKQKFPIAQNQPEQIDQKLVIENILTDYVQLYNAKDMEHFLALFKEDATENGQLQSLLVDQYESLFAHTEEIALNLESIDWQEYKNGFEAKSKFTASYTYKDGHMKEHSGDITFYLTDVHGSLKIQSLEYVFLN